MSRERSDLILSGIAGAALALAVVGAVEWATMAEEGWVCGNSDTGQVVDAKREGRDYVYTDHWAVERRLKPQDQALWLCARINKNAAQMTAPLPREFRE